MGVLGGWGDGGVGGGAAERGLGRGGGQGDEGYHRGDNIGKRPVQARLFSAGVGELLKRSPAGLQPLFGCAVGSFANCHRRYPPFLSNTASSYVWIPSHNAGVVRATRSLTISRL